MATTELSQFRGKGLVAKVVCCPDGKVDAMTLTNVKSVQELEQRLSTGTWRMRELEIACDFTMPRHEEAVFNRIHGRLSRSVAPSSDGVQRGVELLSGKTIRAVVRLTGDRIPPELDQVAGWRAFRFESLRTLFQFKPPQSATVDEELHERLRHALRNLTRHFQNKR